MLTISESAHGSWRAVRSRSAQGHRCIWWGKMIQFLRSLSVLEYLGSLQICFGTFLFETQSPVLLRDVDSDHGNGILAEKRPSSDVRELEGVVHLERDDYDDDIIMMMMMVMTMMMTTIEGAVHQVPVRHSRPSLWLHTLHLRNIIKDCFFIHCTWANIIQDAKTDMCVCVCGIILLPFAHE